VDINHVNQPVVNYGGQGTHFIIGSRVKSYWQSIRSALGARLLASLKDFWWRSWNRCQYGISRKRSRRNSRFETER